MPDDNPIGILGGIFDPIHNGHLALAKLAREYFHLHKVLFIPAGIPAHKKSPKANAPQRLAMLRLSIKHSAEFDIWDGELRRKGPSFTIDTLKSLKKNYPNSPLYFIIGSDNLREISTWRDYREILNLATFCVAHRPGHSMNIPRQLISMTIKKFPGPEWKLSSTMIRRYLASGHSCEFLLPHDVADYIRTNGLYGK
jgi:nicotinate-nucleotide adenylyltransferase